MNQGLEATEPHWDLARVRVLLLPRETLPALACGAGRVPTRQPAIARTLKPCSWQSPGTLALRPVVGCTGHCATLFLHMTRFGALHVEQEHVIHDRGSAKVTLISLFWAILIFAGFRKFLLTASR